MVRVSYHAIQQYQRRLGRESEDPEREILNLFNHSKKERNNPGLVKRKIKYKDNAEYYRNGKWRFVVIDYTVVTVEKDTFEFSGLGFYKNPKNKKSRKAWKWKN